MRGVEPVIECDGCEIVYILFFLFRLYIQLYIKLVQRLIICVSTRI